MAVLTFISNRLTH